MRVFVNHLTNEVTDDAVEYRDGAWYIKPGYAGYNSRANNLWGYVSKARAEAAILRLQY